LARKTTLRGLKAKAWKLFSEYIRRKDADEGGTVHCYTCRAPVYWKEAHAGHFVPGRKNAVLFNEDVVRPQCIRCNIFLGGYYHAYTLRMVDEVGRERVDELLSLRHKVLKLTRSDIEEIIEKYKQKLEELELEPACQ
jgi:NMD protein affecting ribosome stability and mRNA decay